MPLQASQAEVGSTVKSPADVAGSGEVDFVTGMRYNAADRDAFDANDDKKLDFVEFCAFLRDREQGNIPDVELRSRFDALDENGNGFIDMDEYLQWSLKDALSRSSSRVVDLFRAWDEDQSGSVDKREFYKAVKALGFDIRREDTDAVFDSLDEDRSGKLEYAELNKMLRKGVGSERTKRNLKRAPTQRETGRYAKLTAKNMNANYVSARLATLPATVKLTASSGMSVQEQLRDVLKMSIENARRQADGSVPRVG
jgi:Ca2+-binding EF-hand superfamily protein